MSDVSISVVMPQLGQAMESGTLIEWLVEDHAPVVGEQTIALVETDKAAHEIPSPATGILHHAVKAGIEVPVGVAIASISTSGDKESSAITPAAAAALSAKAIGRESENQAITSRGAFMASPRAKALAAGLNVDLSQVIGSSRDGLIVARDVEQWASDAKVEARRLQLSSSGRAAGDRLRRSWQQAPHFVQMIQVDATRLARARELIHAGKLQCTFNDLLIAAAARTLAGFPDLNASFQSGVLVPLGEISIGLAVAADDGLRVPVVHGADRMSLDELAFETRRLVAAARSGVLLAADQGRAAMTISNLGRYGIAFGTPVLNLDEPILVFVGLIEDQPVGVNGKVVLRPTTMLSICFDHRAVDGMRGAMFSQALKNELERLEWAELDEIDEVAAGAGSGADEPTALLTRLIESSLAQAIQDAANEQRIQVDSIENGVGQSPEPDLIAVTLKLVSPASKSELHRLGEIAKSRCPMLRFFRPEVAAGISILKSE